MTSLAQDMPESEHGSLNISVWFQSIGLNTLCKSTSTSIWSCGIAGKKKLIIWKLNSIGGKFSPK